MKGNFAYVSSGQQDWRKLYVTALFEPDRLQLPSRISEAERALVLRARELFAMHVDDCEEGQAIDDALYALKALRHCLDLKTRGPTAA